MCIALALTSSASTGTAASGSFRIQTLSGSVVRFGTWDSAPLYGVRLRARVCFGSASAALRTYRSEFRITHFAVSRSPMRWRPARIVTDRAPALVPFGESWQGKACGNVLVDDSIPATHYGVESLGNTSGCYGVGLTLQAGAKRATKRVIVTCGARFG
jgi:hypothetical protein